MPKSPIESVLVLGAGTMGQQITLACASYGRTVNLYDVSTQALRESEKTLENLTRQMVRETERSPAEVDQILARVNRTTSAAEAAAGVDLVSESVNEDVWLKRKVFAQFHELCPDHTIFTTNSSTLLPKEIAKHSGRADKFAALHFHPNVWYSNVVDVLKVKQAPESLSETLAEFARDIGQIPIVLQKDMRGFVMNRFLVMIFRMALEMVASEKLSIEEVDLSFKGVLKTENGPFGIMDLVGLDTMLSIHEFWRKRLWNLPKLDPVFRKNSALLRSYVEKGYLGLKTGRGFYEYPQEAEQATGNESVNQAVIRAAK